MFILSDAVNIELNIQIASDLVSSKNGRIDGGLYQNSHQR